MKILFFGKLAESFGTELELDLPEAGMSVSDLRALLAASKPEGASQLGSQGARACIDKVMVTEGARIMPGHEVAFVPPLSGG